MSVFVVEIRHSVPENAIKIDTTSRSVNWSKALSPFFVGPIELYDGYVAKNVENAWQFCKVYEQHIDCAGNPSEEYWKWAKRGWDDDWAHRYPMGRGSIPKYSLWDGDKLGYIEARKKIYIPLYSKAVQKTLAFKYLKKILQGNKNIYLVDFDGYNHKSKDMTYDDVINCETRKMGHAFVLAMLLDGYKL